MVDICLKKVFNRIVFLFSTMSNAEHLQLDKPTLPDLKVPLESRRKCLGTIAKGFGGLLVGAGLTGCGYTEQQLDYINNGAELQRALEGSNLRVAPDMEGTASFASTIYKRGHFPCARFMKQEADGKNPNTQYVIYYKSDLQGGDPRRAIDSQNGDENVQVFKTVEEAAKFLKDTFDTPQAVAAEKE